MRCDRFAITLGLLALFLSSSGIVTLVGPGLHALYTNAFGDALGDPDSSRLFLLSGGLFIIARVVYPCHLLVTRNVRSMYLLLLV